MDEKQTCAICVEDVVLDLPQSYEDATGVGGTAECVVVVYYVERDVGNLGSSFRHVDAPRSAPDPSINTVTSLELPSGNCAVHYAQKYP